MNYQTGVTSSRGILACVAVALLAAAAVTPRAAGRGQTPQVPGTFRTHITLVPVDVRVIDRDGKPVTNLTQDDFTILEDGVRQDIRHFSRNRLVPDTSAAESAPALRGIPTLDLAPQNNRTFLFVLGNGRLQEPSKGLDATIRFVHDRLLPQDRVAVVAFNRATDFTTDHAKVGLVVERFKAEHERIQSLLAQRFGSESDGTPALAAIYGTKDIPANVQQLIDEVFQGPGTPVSRKLPPGAVPDASRIDDDARRTMRAMTDLELATQLGRRGGAPDMSTPASRSEAERDAGGFVVDLPFGTYVSNYVATMQDLQNLYAGIQYMRYLEGEKHLVFVCEQGLFLPRVEDDHSLAAVANDARVVIDTIQTGGLWGGPLPSSYRSRPPIPGPSISHTFAMGTLKTISELTGGLSSIYRYADPALNRIDETTMSGYLLGYYPSNADWNGSYRKIDVKVDRPRVTVLFRHGYYGREVLVPFDREAFLSYSRIASAAAYDGDVHDLEVSLKASFVKGQGGAKPGVSVEVRVDLARVKLEEAGDRRVGVLDIAVFCADTKDDLVGDLWRKMDLNLTGETYLRLMKDGVTHTALVPVKSRPIYVKAIVYDRGADLIGSKVVTLR